MPCRLALLVFLLASAPRASETPESLVREKLLAPLAVRGRSTERAARDFARLPGMRSRAASCQNEAYPTSPSRALPTTWAKKLG